MNNNLSRMGTTWEEKEQARRRRQAKYGGLLAAGALLLGTTFAFKDDVMQHFFSPEPSPAPVEQSIERQAEEEEEQSSATYPKAVYQSIAASIKTAEGFGGDESKDGCAYKDPLDGHWTIGYGTLLEPGIVNPHERLAVIDKSYHVVVPAASPGDSCISPITREEGETLLYNDLKDAYADAEQIINTFHEQPAGVQEIVVDMVYNLGRDGFLEFENAIHSLEQKNYAQAAEHMFDSEWVCQTKTRAQDHINTLYELAGVDTRIAYWEGPRCEY